MKIRKMLNVLASISLIMGLAGCTASKDAGSESSSVSSETTVATTTTAATTEEVKENLSGEMTIYTSQPEADIQALLEEFNKEYSDIKVNVFRSGTEEVISKILAEKETNSVQADALLVSDAVTFEILKKEDLLMSYKSEELEGISSEYYDSENTYTGTKIISTGIVINTDMISTDITSYKDLTDESLKDNMIMPSPLYSGAAAYNLGVLTKTEGMGWEFFESLKANGIEVVQGNGAVQKAVIAGEKSCGIVVDYLALRAKADGSPVEFIYPTEGSLIVTEPIGIIKGTKNEDLAKAFVDFILSEEGQTATSEIGYTPIKSGIAAPEGFKTVDEIKNLTYNINTLVETRNDDKEQFSKLFE